MSTLTFAYYCSGHGYGHATRVSAVATYLCQMDSSPTVYIVSSAPKHVFAQAVTSGALYRFAAIDPVIVQPLAYHVDRRKSVDVLKKFLAQEDEKVEEEVLWLKEKKVNCVLSDAAFLACKAANAALIPSVLITNFTFDSVYSYLSIKFPEGSSPVTLLSPNASHDKTVLPLDDEPIPLEELEPIVKKLHDGYRCADLLIRLPGNIPIPSFGIQPTLPSYLWTHPEHNSLHAEIISSLSCDISSGLFYPSVPFPVTSNKRKFLPRKVVQSPLIVRHPSEDAYSLAGRKRILDAVGVPAHLQNSKVLVVSFGGQAFLKPSCCTPSRSHSPASSHAGSQNVSRTSSEELSSSSGSGSAAHIHRAHHEHASHKSKGFVHVTAPIATQSHLWVPGAPPASKTLTKPSRLSTAQLQPLQDATDSPRIKMDGPDSEETCNTLSSSDEAESAYSELSDLEPETQFLPDASWIAIVCEVSSAPKSSDVVTSTGSAADSDFDEMPANFFVAPRDVYMPDLTAISDVLLGKLGYGTVAECVDAATPFVYVPRPLFVEEHGLLRLLRDEGIGLELSREMYEAGEWAEHVRKAWEDGRERKARKREVGENGERRKEGERMARELVEWVREWQRADSDATEKRKEENGEA